MKRSLVFLALLTLLARAETFREHFQHTRAGGDHEAMVKLLEEAKDKEQGNPDYYALASNYWWTCASQPNISTKPAAKGEPAITDPKTGKAIGSISDNGELDPTLRQKALDLTTEGYRKFPLRLDIGFGLAFVQFHTGRQDAAVATIKAILTTAKEQPDQLLWSDNKPLPAPAKDFIPRSIQGYTAPLFREETPKTDALCKELCEATIAIYPDHPFAYNLLAVLADAQGDKAKALEYLKTAHTKDPQDPLILDNLARAYREGKQTNLAIEAYRKLLALELDDETQERAKVAIKELTGAKEK